MTYKKQNPFNALNKPFNPSAQTKLGRERVVDLSGTIPEGVPATQYYGVDVSEWHAVLVTIHPTNPELGDATLEGATVDCRIWRWRRAANYGAETPSGQWFAEEEFTVALDGNMIRDESMERVFPTNVAEQMYLEVIGYNIDVCDVAIGFYGLGQKRGEGGEAIYLAAAGHQSVNNELNANLSSDVSFPGDHIYSNLREDFDAAIATTATITLTNLPAWLTVADERIVAIGMKPAAGSADWTFIYVRGSDFLKVSYAAGTITFDDAILTVGADIAVWLEDIPRYQGSNIDATYHLQVRDEAFTIATRSERVEEIDPLDTKYVGDTIADVTNGTDGTYNYYVDMSTFRKATFQLELNGGSGTVTVKLYGTVQDDGTAAASCTYQDIGNATFGAANWTADAILNDNSEMLAGYKYLKIEVVAATGAADDADWTIYMKRLY